MLPQLQTRIRRDQAAVPAATNADRLLQRLTGLTSQFPGQQRAITETRQALADTLDAVAEEVSTWRRLETRYLGQQLRLWTANIRTNELEKFTPEDLTQLRAAALAIIIELGDTPLERKRRRLLNHLMQTEINRY